MQCQQSVGRIASIAVTCFSSFMALIGCSSSQSAGLSDQPANTGGFTMSTGGTSELTSGSASGGRTFAEGGTEGSLLSSLGGAVASGGASTAGGARVTGGFTSTGGGKSTGGSATASATTGGRSVGGSTTGGIADGGTTVGQATGSGSAAGSATGGTTTGRTTTGRTATGGTATGGTATGGTATGGTTTGGTATGGTANGGSSGIFNPPYILGADISWTLEQESVGRKYADGGVTKSVERIFADHGFNFIRLRTFVCPTCPGGYTSNLYSGARNTEAFCDTAHTIRMAKRVKACRMGVFLDFHMSDNWASIGHQEVPSQWAGMSASQMQAAAYSHVKGVMDEMVAAGVKPDMVQVGNETNSAMSGVSMSNWANFSGLVNAGIRAVRETDPKLPVYAQHGRPRPDGNFEPWVDSYLGKSPPIDVDGICGSTYGTTNNGDDWRQEFGYVISKYKRPVMSCEYTDQRRELINSVMHGLANGMGRGTFLWEPTAYSDYTLFTLSGSTYATNSRMAAYDALAKSYGLPVPSSPAATLDAMGCK